MSTPTGDLTLPLRDVIDIPETVHAADFVLRLADGVNEGAERTLDDYVVTPSITRSFGEALGLVESALDRHASRGAFIHGSFGAGKSHFMAVLDLMLSGNAHARSLPGLQATVAKHERALSARLFAVDYHLLGSESLEQALFSGYVAAVARRHPDAPAPVLHTSDGLLDDADHLREQFGDDTFFAKLGGTAPEEAGWGDQAGGWTAETYDAARRLPPTASDRQRLVSDLVATFFTSATRTGEWLGIQDGLRVMTDHVKSLGYDGLVLFLDELVLWLGQHLGNSTFIQSETSKVTKLVETDAGLAVPIISFVARQRELKGFLSGSSTGAEQVTIGDSFRHWEDRFDKIVLEAADLPDIVHRRLLEPKDERGAAALAAAARRVGGNQTAMRYLLDDEVGSSGDDFAKIYPFSPALVDAMVALSTILQRERTALKIMSELLSEGRDDLTVGDVIPVGDVFDVVVLGDTKPLTEDMTKLFEIAATFYRQKVRPYLLDKHGLTEEAALALPRKHVFRTEDRLLKTLLVGEIAPGARSLRSLTASKLAALNYGNVGSFIPGDEARTVIGYVNQWRSEFGEISLGSGNDPVVSIQLSGVDYDAVLDNVQGEDTSEARRRLLRELILGELGVSAPGGLVYEYTFRHVWQGQRWEADLVFGNVRDDATLHDGAFMAAEGRWKVVVDFPFDDDATHGPASDLARIERLRTDGLVSDTIIWVPHFLTTQRMEDLGTLVQLEYLLTGQHFDENAGRLAVNDREPARRALQARRESLREQLQTALRQAYAVQAPTPEHIGTEVPPGNSFVTLTSTGLQLRMPIAPTLTAGLTDVLQQALTHQYPDHPQISQGDSELKKSELAAALELARRAASGGGRVEGVDRTRVQSVRRVVQGLRLGELRENVYVLDRTTFGWWDRFTKWTAGEQETSAQVLREALSEYGLSPELEDLLILAWAALADREIRSYGAIVTPPPGISEVRAQTSFKEPTLPDAGDWEEAVRRAQVLFGVGSGELYRNSAGVQRVARGIKDAVDPVRESVDALPRLLAAHARVLGADPDAPAGRLATAYRARDLVDLLSARRDANDLITELAAFDLPNETAALARSISSARSVGAALQGANWQILDQIGTLDDGPDAAILDDLRGAATRDELHSALEPALRTAAERMTTLLVERRPAPPRPDDAEERRREEERIRAEAERREREAADRQARQDAEAKAAEAERRAREAEEQLEAERRRQQEEADRRRAAEEADEAARRRRAAGATVTVAHARDLEEVTARLLEVLAEPAEGRSLRVTWRWE